MELCRCTFVILFALVFSICSGNTVSRFNTDRKDPKDEPKENQIPLEPTETGLSVNTDHKLSYSIISRKPTAGIKISHVSNSVKTFEKKTTGLTSTRHAQLFSELSSKRRPLVLKLTNQTTKLKKTQRSSNAISEVRTSKQSKRSTVLLQTSSKSPKKKTTLTSTPAFSTSSSRSSVSTTDSVLSTRKAISSSTLFTYPPQPSAATATAKPSSNKRQLKRIVIILLAILIVSLSILFVIILRGGCSKRSRHITVGSSPAYYELKNVHM